MDDQEELERIFVAMYLDANAHFHCDHSLHSWPCGMWDASSSPIANLSWGDLYEHGIVPVYWRVLTEDPDGKTS